MRVRIISAVGATLCLALGAGFANADSLTPGWVADVQADGGPPAWQATLHADGAPPAFVGDPSGGTSADESTSETTTSNEDTNTGESGDDATSQGMPDQANVPSWVDDVKANGGPPSWVDDVKTNGGPADWVSTQKHGHD